jgi:RNase P protein component
MPVNNRVNRYRRNRFKRLVRTLTRRHGPRYVNDYKGLTAHAANNQLRLTA